MDSDQQLVSEMTESGMELQQIVISNGGAPVRPKVIRDFQIGEDVLVINNVPNLTFLDLVNPLRVDAGAEPLIEQVGDDTVVSLPDGVDSDPLAILKGITATDLIASPESFQINSPGNVIIDWNELTFDAIRTSQPGGPGTPIGIPPAASTRFFALVDTAMYDAVQGIMQTEGRNTYLETQGIDLNAPENANAEAAAASAAFTILNGIFTDPDNPSRNPAIVPALQAALDTTLSAIPDGQAETDGVNFGQSVGNAFLELRANDGAYRMEDGTPVDPAQLATEYVNGIEPESALLNGGAGLVNDESVAGTVGRLLDGTNLVGQGKDGTTPGAWRRAEDTQKADGSFDGLASIEVSQINQAWVLPETNWFNDLIPPPPALDSQRYINAVNEVYAEGSITDLPFKGNVIASTNRDLTVTENLGPAANDRNRSDSPYVDFNRGGLTPGGDGIGTTSEERTIISHIWANANGSYAPNAQWQGIAQDLAIEAGTSLEDTAYIFANLNLTLADGFINIWDIKWDDDYFWRPVSSIRQADELTGTENLDDDLWTPRQVTPQHPCHPSGTSMTAGAASQILANFFGADVEFTTGADVHPNGNRLRNALTDTDGDGIKDVNGTPLDEVSKTYTNLFQAADEARLSRIYSGAHFRFATETGITLGREVANFVIDTAPLGEF